MAPRNEPFFRLFRLFRLKMSYRLTLALINASGMIQRLKLNLRGDCRALATLNRRASAAVGRCCALAIMATEVRYR